MQSNKHHTRTHNFAPRQDVLQNTVGGGKPKMKYHFGNNGWPASIRGPVPETEEARNKLVDDLQVYMRDAIMEI